MLNRTMLITTGIRAARWVCVPALAVLALSATAAPTPGPDHDGPPDFEHHAGPHRNHRMAHWLPGPLLSTSVTVHQRVPSHLQRVEVMAQAAAGTAVKAQNELGAAISNALSDMPDGIKTSTNSYRVWREYQSNQHKKGQWYAREVLALEGANRKQLLAAADTLASDGLAVQSLDYGISDKQRTNIHHRLLSRAIRELRDDLSRMARGNDCHGFNMERMSTGSPQRAPHPKRMRAALSRNAKASHVTAPPSHTTLSVTISGKARGMYCAREG